MVRRPDCARDWRNKPIARTEPLTDKIEEQFKYAHTSPARQAYDNLQDSQPQLSANIPMRVGGPHAP